MENVITLGKLIDLSILFRSLPPPPPPGLRGLRARSPYNGNHFSSYPFLLQGCMHGVGESTGALLSFLYLFRHYLKFPKCNISEKVVRTSLASYTILHVTLAEFLYAALTIMVICYKLNSNIFYHYHHCLM